MITYKCEIGSMRDFPAWGQAKDVIREVEKAGKMNALDAYIADVCNMAIDSGELETKGSINDLLAYEWESIYEAIGMPVE